VTDPAPNCTNCGAIAASDQDYCVECGARIVTGSSPWPATIAVIGVVLAIAIAVVAMSYRGFVHDADRDAAAPSPVSTQAAKAGTRIGTTARKSATRRRTRKSRSR
jgi:hypothetical protein